MSETTKTKLAAVAVLEGDTYEARAYAASGATFQQLTQEARRELARHYLLHSSLELNQTAYLLGYEDAHSFFRAFNDWEGTSPGAWRARHSRSPRSETVAPVQ